MKFSKKKIIVLLFVIGIAGLLVGSIAYYRIVVNGSITGSTGNAVFVLRDTEAGESWNNKVISLGKINPGDSGSFDVVMDASGSTVDMYATLNIDRGSGDAELPTNLKFYTTSDHKSELHKYYSFLEKSGTNKETLTIYWYWNPYISDEEDKKYVNKTFSTTINVNAVQISEYVTMSKFSSNNYKPYIRTINFGNDLSNLPSTCNEENLCWDISESPTQKKRVYGYLVDTGLKDSTDNTKSLYNLYIVSEAPIFAPSSCIGLFSFLGYVNNNRISNLIQINFNNNFNTSNVTDMSAIFSDCSFLTSLDLSSFNTSKVTDMGSMFSNCSSLTSLDLSSFNTANVTDMSWMFDGSSLTNIDLSSFNTSKVTTMGYMFNFCSSLTNLDLSSFNTANVTNMLKMFSNCSSLTSLDLSSFNTANVTDMSVMFNDCSSLTSLDLSNFNTSKVTNMEYMFYGCSSLTSLDLSGFNNSNITNMEYMFYNCSKLQTTINILNASTTYTDIFAGNALTDTNANVIIGYTAETKAIAEAMKETAGSNKSKITLKQI